MKVKREAACLCVCELRFFYTSCAAPLPTHCPLPTPFLGSPPLRLRIYFLILLTRHNAEEKTYKRNCSTSTMHSMSAAVVAAAVLTCVRLMLISSRRPPPDSVPIPILPHLPSLACLRQLTSLCPAQPRNEKLNCVTRS